MKIVEEFNDKIEKDKHIIKLRNIFEENDRRRENKETERTINSKKKITTKLDEVKNIYSK